MYNFYFIFVNKNIYMDKLIKQFEQERISIYEFSRKYKIKQKRINR